MSTTLLLDLCDVVNERTLQEKEEIFGTQPRSEYLKNNIADTVCVVSRYWKSGGREWHGSPNDEDCVKVS